MQRKSEILRLVTTVEDGTGPIRDGTYVKATSNTAAIAVGLICAGGRLAQDLSIGSGVANIRIVDLAQS